MQDGCFQGLSPRLIQAMEAAVNSSPAALALVDADYHMHVASPSLGKLVGRDWPQLLGSNYLDLFPAEEQLIMSERLQKPPDPLFFFPTRLQHVDGSTREVDGRCYRLDIPEEQWTVIILVDVTSERRLLRKLGGISLVASSLTYAGGLRATLNSLAERVVETTEAIAASVLTCEELPQDDFRFRLGGSFGLPTEGLELVEEALSYHREAAAMGLEFPPVRARCTRQPEVVTSLRSKLDELNLELFPPALQQMFRMAHKQVWNTMVAVPVQLGTRFLGTLNCYYVKGPPEAAEITYLRTLADLAAVGVENARLVEESERQAILQERRRLARELHDSVSQALYGIALGARTVKARWESHPEKAHQSLDYVIELAEGAGKEMRALLYSLRPESLEEEGLVQALRRQAEALQARYGIQVDFKAHQEPVLDSASRLALFRVASESLHNVVKHSGARHVRMLLDGGKDQCVLEVVDDGIGFDPLSSGPDQYGLDSMRERVEGVGGHWQLRSAAGQGTTIRAVLDLPARQVQVRGTA
jgi:signal transduction histidine kinase